MRGTESIRYCSTAAAVCALAQLVGIACSHEHALDAIETTLRADGGAGGQSNPITSTGGTSSTGGAEYASSTTGGAQAWVDAIRLPPGVPTLCVTTGDFTHYDQHDRSLAPTPITVEGQTFVLGQRFPYGSGNGVTPGSAGYFGPIQSAVAKNDLLRTFFWMRCETPDPTIDECQSAVVFEKGVAPYTNGGLESPIHVGQEWTLFTPVFMPLDTYDVGNAQLTFRLGYPDQVLEIGAIGLEDYGTSLTLQQLEALDVGPFAEVMAQDSLASYGTAVQSESDGTEYPFGKAINFTTYGQTFAAPEDSGLQGRTSARLQPNDLLLVRFWAHCVETEDPSGNCRTSLVFEEGNSPYVNAGLQTTTIAVRPTWQQYFFPFRAVNGYAAEEVKLGLRLGYSNQTIEFGPISLRLYDPSFSIADMPVSSLE